MATSKKPSMLKSLKRNFLSHSLNLNQIILSICNQFVRLEMTNHRILLKKKKLFVSHFSSILTDKCSVFVLFRSLVMTENAFRARDIGLRAQKKILSRMATKTVAKTFIDGTTAALLDNIYRLAKLHVSLTTFCGHNFLYWTEIELECATYNCLPLQTGNKKEAERLVKNIIKIVIKIGILHRNNQFNADELKVVERFRSKFQVNAFRQCTSAWFCWTWKMSLWLLHGLHE